jgi:Lon protease-like protein
MAALERDFPLFPLGLVALPAELVPLHIFEARYRAMIDLCLDEDREFGIVWADEDGVRPIGCAMEIEQILERMEDGRINIVTRGTRVFRLVSQQADLPYPAGTVEFLDDEAEEPDEPAGEAAREAYSELVQEATDKEMDDDELQAMTSYDMAATVDFGLEAKQELLDLRSENARLAFVARLFRAATRRLDFIERAQARARSNGKVRFG